MVISYWLPNLIPAFLLLFLAWGARRQLGSWLVPSAFFCLYWSIALIIPLILAPDFGLWPGAVWLILIFGFCLHLGVLIGISINKRRPYKGRICYRLHWGEQILLIAIISGLASAIILVLSAGYSLTAFFNPNQIVRIGLIHAGMRYSGEYFLFSMLINIFNIFFYMGGFVSGILLVTKPSLKSRTLALLLLFIGVFNGFLVNARTGLIWLVVFFISSYTATLVLCHRHKKLFKFRMIALPALIMVVVLSFFFILQMIRERQYSTSIEMPIAKTRVFTLGPPFMFSHWLRDKGLDVRPSWGIQTFNGLFYFLGMPLEQALGWTEGTEVTVGGKTYAPNVYTVFRQLIEDFTLPGAIIVITAFGILVGTAYRKVLNGKYVWLPALSAFYAFVLGSYLASWLSYTTLFLSWILFLFIVSTVGPRLLRPISSRTSE